jgi:hypothetical protein
LRGRLRHLALLVGALTLFGAVPAGAATIPFAGTTDQGQPLTLALAGSGRHVSMQVGYTVACTSGLSFPDAETVNAPAHPTLRGRRVSAVKFSAEGSGSVQAATAGGQQVAGTLDIVVAGDIRVRSGHATGRVEATITLSNGDKCTSGNAPIRWTAAVAAPAPKTPSP